MKAPPDQAVVQAQDITRYFPVRRNAFSRARQFVHAVDGVSFIINREESFGLVGESGCGKTTVGKLLVKLLEPTAGHLFLGADGGLTDYDQFGGERLKSFRRRVQMIFQDPYEAMNPRRTIYDTVLEPMAVQGLGHIQERQERVAQMLALVGLSPPSTFLFRYPHELSGGQRQRIAIARALILGPALVVADEPTSMLDVSIRTGIMKLMQALTAERHISYLYITHDLAVARYMCQRIAVMYLGKIVELAETEELLRNPLHPYTQALISAVPIPQPGVQRPEVAIKGSIPSPVDPEPRCRFYDRCLRAAPVCLENDHPPLEEKANGHWVACYRA